MDKLNILIDFDSTISSVELLPEIFKIALHGDSHEDETLERVNSITKAGMAGEMPFSQSLEERINLLPLTRDLIRLMVVHVSALISPSFAECVDELNQHNLHIISGAFSDIIVPVLAEYNIYPNQIHANKFIFDGDNFSGIDKTIPLVHDKGKVQVVENLNLTGTTVIIGDGITDFQVKEAGFARFFVAYTEHVRRENVINVADFTASDFHQVCVILKGITS